MRMIQLAKLVGPKRRAPADRPCWASRRSSRFLSGVGLQTTGCRDGRSSSSLLAAGWNRALAGHEPGPINRLGNQVTGPWRRWGANRTRAGLGLLLRCRPAGP